MDARDMIDKLNMLVVADSELDIPGLIEKAVKAGFEPVYERVETKEDMVKALARESWDIIIADYDMPSFIGTSALELAMSKSPETPFIYTAVQLSEDQAVELIKAGARDYVCKSDLSRLTSIVVRETTISQARKEQNRMLELYGKIFHSAPEMIVISVLQSGLFLDVNEAFESLSGYSRDEIIGRTSFELGIWGDYVQRNDLIRQLQSGEPIRNLEASFRRKDGTLITTLLSADKVDYQGQQCSLIMASDISERKRIENALRESQERLRATFNNAGVGIVEVEGDQDRYTAVNERFCRILGYRCDELVGKSVHDVTYLEERRESDMLNALLHAGEADIIDYEKRYIKKDGTPIWVHVTVSPLRDANGRWLRSIATIEDISKRKSAEEQLLQLNRDLELRNAELSIERERWQGVVEGIADEVWIADEHGIMSLINVPTETQTGLKEFKNKTLEEVLQDIEIFHPDGRPRPEEESPLLRSLRGEIVRGEEIVRNRHTGRVRYRQFSSAPTRDATGKITGAVAIVRDITDQKQLEEALHAEQEHKLEFYRRTISASTGGKLIVTDYSEIQRLAGSSAMTWNLEKAGDLEVVRNGIHDFALLAGMDEARVGKLVMSVGEAATNAIKHADAGVVSAHRLPGSLMVVVSDKGQGIPALALPEVALRRGYSTAGTLGMGYKIMISFADKVYLATGIEGTMVGIEMTLHAPPTQSMGIEIPYVVIGV